MNAVPFLLAMALIAPLAAQEPGTRMPRPRLEPPQQPQTQRVVPQGQGRGGQLAILDEGVAGDLPESNFTISLEGTLSSGPAVDLQLTGSGPSFTADQTIGEEGSILSCQYKLSKTEKGYRVSYSIGTQLRVATVVSKGQNEMTNYEFRSIVLSGAVLCKPGAPVVIARNAGKALTLTVAEVPVP